MIRGRPVSSELPKHDSSLVPVCIMTSDDAMWPAEDEIDCFEQVYFTLTNNVFHRNGVIDWTVIADWENL